MSEDTKLDRPSRPSLRQIETMPDFGPRYRVIDAIGKGGMGEVYRAYDTELKGEVALKIVRGDADADAALARFRREIALARKVTSPNVLRVYDLAEHEGLRFLSMELVDGEDLGALMRREKRVPIERALEIIRQVCRGLEAAHAQGVVHRDLKPHNVLVAKDGHVRVADFGLARSIGESGMTASGAILGSPAYMSPEQVKGDPTDERSDIYSLGVMLYQLVTGEAPFRGDTPHAVMEMRLHKKPRPLADASPDAPAHLAAIVDHCLAVDPEQRYRSVRELLADLEAERVPVTAPRPRPKWLVPALAAAIGAVGIIIAVLAWSRGNERRDTTAPVSTAPAAPAIAHSPANGHVTVLVLGFENHTIDPVFQETLEVVIETALRHSTRVDPIAGSEVKNLEQELGADASGERSLGKRLAERDGVRVVNLRGTIVPKGAGFALSIEAEDAETEQRVFAQTVAVPSLDSVLAATARLASGLRDALGDPVPEDQRELTGLSSSIDADHEFALGRALSRASNNPDAIVHLQQAIARDPSFALAHQQFATALWNDRRLMEANAQYRAALGLVDQMCERDRLSFLADYYDTVTEEHERASATYEQLLATWPHDIRAETNLPLSYQARGDFRKTLETGLSAAHDHPHDVTIRSNIPPFELMNGLFERAVVDARQLTIDFARPLPTTHLYLAVASVLLGRRGDAVAAYAKYAELEPSAAAFAQADFAMAEGRLAEADRLLGKGLADDVAAKDGDSAETKRAMLAELRLRHGDNAGARAMAALVVTEPPRVLQAALVEVDAGDDKRALDIAARFGADPAPSRRAIAKLIEGESLRVHGKPGQAMIAFQDSIHLVDVPLAHFLLARAALDAKRFDDAYSELRTCLTRRGEAAVDVNDVPSYRYIPPFTYYLAKAQDGLGSPAAKATYQAFLAMMHDPDPADPLVADAHKHVQ